MASGTILSIEQSEDKYRRYFVHGDKCVHRGRRRRTATDTLVPSFPDDTDLVKLNAMFDPPTTTTTDEFGRTVEKYECGLTVARGRFTELRNWLPATPSQVDDRTKSNQDAKSSLLSRHLTDSSNLNSDSSVPCFSNPSRRSRRRADKRTRRREPLAASSTTRPRPAKTGYIDVPMFGNGFGGALRQGGWNPILDPSWYISQIQPRAKKPNATNLQQSSSPPKVAPPSERQAKSSDASRRPLFGFGNPTPSRRCGFPVSAAPIRASTDQPRIPAPSNLNRAPPNNPLPSLMEMTTGLTAPQMSSRVNAHNRLGFSRTRTVVVAPMSMQQNASDAEVSASRANVPNTLSISDTYTVIVAPSRHRSGSVSSPPTSLVEPRMRMPNDRRLKCISELQQRLILRREQ
uniref:Expressed conserved protein n=1 Tax=Panagrellus redivivus TaxID=6233 RepID=A0A7E4UZ75_PANRE